MGAFGDVGLFALDRIREGFFVFVVFVPSVFLVVGGRTGDPPSAAVAEPSVSTHGSPLFVDFLPRLYFSLAHELLERGSFVHFIFLWQNLL